MENALALRLVLSFVLGGGAVALFTTLAERRGSRLGGLLLSFPVKVVISLSFIAWTEGTAFAAQAAMAVPAGLGVNVVFLVATALLVRRFRPWPAMTLALVVWLAAGVLVIARPAHSLITSVGYWALTAGIGLALLSRVPGIRADRRPARANGDKFGVAGMLSRAAGAGAVVALSVVIAHYGGTFLGGLASVFPSGWITTMVILTRKHGPDFTAATTRVMVAASAAPVMFGVVAALLMARVGAPLGIALGVGAAFVVSMAVAGLLHLRDRRDLATRPSAGH